MTTSDTIPQHIEDTTAETIELPLLARGDTVVFPRMMAQLMVRSERSQHALEYAASHDHRVVVVSRKTPPPADVTMENIYLIGTEASVIRTLRVPEGLINVWLQGERRVRVSSVQTKDGYVSAMVEPLEDHVEMDNTVEALMRESLTVFENCVNLANIPQEAYIMALNADEPGVRADLITAALDIPIEQRQEVLEILDARERLERVSLILVKEQEVLEIQNKIHAQMQDEVDKTHREFYLREQLKAIQQELGQIDPLTREANSLREKMEAAGMPEEVRVRVQEELDRLTSMPPGNPEVTVSRNYIDWLVNLPWSQQTEDQLNIARAAKVLNQNHYGLSKVKERILEYMAVRKLAKDRLRSPILCFVGPPGVGKTSLGRSIAEALGRKFVRISLGGIRDEAEIRGHRRTYIGSLPGRIIQTMRQAGTVNPLFMLDEIDKVGTDFRGDPSSALLEVLDPEQNHAFSDHYLEVPYSLSKVLFIATANLLDTILPALRDRLEIIELPGYTEHEKLEIARNFLVPKQIKEHGLEETGLNFTNAALQSIIQDYTREAGVRSLEREIGSVCRKIAKQVASEKPAPSYITAKGVTKYLGPKQFFWGTAELEDQVGVATGVAKTAQGGDVLSVEVVLMEGKGNLILTGQLGDVMRESAQAALSYARTRAAALGIDSKVFEHTDVHIHVPEGAVPKDGPSAGITLATALISALTHRPVSREVAMTGEITLRGRVLPIGGLKEKALAAHRAGIKTFIAPVKNRNDTADLPADVRREVRFVFVEHMDQVLATALRETAVSLQAV